MTSTSHSTDNLGSSVPKLAVDGLNWVIFEYRFEVAVNSRKKWGHFNGSAVCPTLPSPVAAVLATATAAAIPASPTPEETAAYTKWIDDEATAKNLLTQKIPDSTAIKIRKCSTVADAWKTIVTEFTAKGDFAQTTARNEFLQMKCLPNGNVKQFLEDLAMKKETLAAVGVDVDEKDYMSTVINSLPSHLSRFATSTLAAARLSGATVKVESLITVVSEEYTTRRSQAGAKSKIVDEVLAFTPDRKSKPTKSSFDKAKNIICWNCGKKGHFKSKCTEPPKDSGSRTKTKNGNRSYRGIRF